MVRTTHTIYKTEIQHKHRTSDQRRSNNTNRMEDERSKNAKTLTLGIETQSNTTKNKIGKRNKAEQNQNR